MSELHARAVAVALAFSCVLVTSASPVRDRELSYRAPRDANGTQLTLRRDRSRVILFDERAGAIVASAPAAGLQRVLVTGADGDRDDTLTVDLSQPLTLPGGIEYDGGAAGWDTLEIKGGHVRNERVIAENAHDGVFDLDGLRIRYLNLEPINDTAAAATLSFSGTIGSETINIVNGPIVSGFQTTQINSATATFELVNFANKTTVNLAGGGGTDPVVFNLTTPAAGLSTLTVTGVSTATQTGPVVVPNLRLSATGAVTLTNLANDVTTLAASAGGAFAYRDANALTVGTVGGLSGITGSSTVSVETVDGPLTISQLVNAGANAVSVSAGSAAGQDRMLSITLTGGITSGSLTLTGDGISIDPAASAGAGAGTAIVQPFDSGTLVNLGGADAANTLGLTDGELDRITAAIVRVGRATSGDLSFTAAISPALTNQLELVSGAQILGSGAVPTELTVTRAGFTAAGNIGSSLTIAASNAEAQTTNGDITFSSTGALTIGDVNASLQGLRVISNGSVNVTTAGTMSLSDNSGVQTVTSGASSGSVTLTATGGLSNVQGVVNRDSILSPRGTVSVTAGQDILFGAIGADFDNDVRAWGSISFSAGRFVTIDGFSDVAADDQGGVTGGSVLVSAGSAFNVSDLNGVDGSLGVTSSAGGGGVVVNAPAVNLTANSPAALFSPGGTIQLITNRLTISSDSGISATAGPVIIEPQTPGVSFNLGSITDVAASTIEISDTEFDRITTPTIFLGSADAGNINFTDNITPLAIGTLSLITPGAFTGGTFGPTVNTLALNDMSSFGKTWTLTPTQITGFATFPYSATNVTLNAGSGNDTINVTPSATTAFTVNGANPSTAPGDLFRVDLTGVTNPAVPNNTGNGTVTSSNRLPVVFAQFERIPPHVTLHPVNQTVTEGATATFTAAASGLATPAVQWEVSTNGGGLYSNVPGATSPTLSFTAQGSQNGNLYRARFINSSGNVVSSAAALTVKLATSTVVLSAPNPSFTGRQVGITATITPPAATGTVTFTDNASPLATVPLSSGSAAVVTILSTGTHDIVATYGGDSTYAGSSDNTIHQVIEHIVGRGDFNGDGKTDVLWRHNGTGDIRMWLMDGFNIISDTFVSSPGGTYTAVGVADFNGDGKSDILLRDAIGDIGMWLMNGTTIATGAFVGSPGSTYNVVAVGDFNGDGRADVLLRDHLGTLGMWMMNGAVIASGSVVGSPGGTYSVVAATDFNGDARADILLRDQLGNIGMWLMNGATITAGALVGSPGAYTVAGAADYNGDNRGDILLRHAASGDLGMWLMNGATITSGAFVGSPGPFDVVGVGDYNANARADILIQHNTTGELGVWFMNGSAVTSGAFVGAAPVSNTIVP